MRPHLALPVPIGVYAYFDKIQFWVRRPLDLKTLAKLERACGKGGIHIENRPARFNNRQRQYWQKIQLRQPSQRALRWLARHSDVLINQAEFTLDLTFKYRADAEEAWDFLHQHLVRRWHRRSQKIRIVRSPPLDDEPDTGETRYDAGGQAPNLFVVYAEDHSRVTGELNCIHIEWRVSSSRAIRAVGIESGQDLLEFDHRAFWQKRLLLYAVDRRRLGRLYRNRVTGKRRRTPEIRRLGRFAYDIEGKTGEICARLYETVQELIDRFKPSFRIHRALIRIPHESLLPERKSVG